MINKSLFIKEFKANFLLFTIILAVLTMYIFVSIYMYNPHSYDAIKSFRETMPQLMDAMGMSFDDASLTGFLNSYLFGFLYIVLPIIYEIILANKLIVKYVDNGSMAFLLSSPNTRTQIAVTQAFYLIVSLTVMLGLSLGIGITASHIQWPGELNIGKFVLLHFGALGLHIFISGFCFFFSCHFDEAKQSYSFGAGVAIGFYVLQMIAAMGDKVEKVKYFTFYTLFDTSAILSGNNSVLGKIILLYFMGFLFYIAAIYRFQHKNLML